MAPSDRFEGMTEQDVREEIIQDILRKLGYRTNTENDIRRNMILSYPYLFIGHKKPGKDPQLRGYADYVLEAQRRVRWVLEAKAPDIAIDREVVEQAWSYGVHPEVKAVYFAICNGPEFAVYRSSDGARAEPILKLGHEQCDSRFHVIEGLLSPDSLIRTFPENTIDLGLPIAKGLRSSARIVQGFILYDSSSIGENIFTEIVTWIIDGSLKRTEQGTLVASLKATVPFRSIQELNERLGLSDFEMTSPEGELSTDPARPTPFVYDDSLVLPAGEKLLNISTWSRTELPFDVHYRVMARATGYLTDRAFQGKFQTKLQFLGRQIDLSGSFRIELR